MDSIKRSPEPNSIREFFVGLACVLAFGWLGYFVAGVMPHPETGASAHLSASSASPSN